MVNMNKYILCKYLCIFAILLLITSLLCTNVFASGSGACSGHGGVACSMGPDSDGSVICNDGYRDSSVQYDDCEKCTIDSNNDTANNNGNSSNNRNSSNKKENSGKIKDSKNSNSKFLYILIVFFVALVIKNLFSIKKEKNKNNIRQGNNYNGPLCPICGNRMVLRTGKYGMFYGCVNYPKCKGTRRINYQDYRNCPKCGSQMSKKYTANGIVYVCKRTKKCGYIEKDERKVDI